MRHGAESRSGLRSYEMPGGRCALHVVRVGMAPRAGVTEGRRCAGGARGSTAYGKIGTLADLEQRQASASRAVYCLQLCVRLHLVCEMGVWVRCGDGSVIGTHGRVGCHGDCCRSDGHRDGTALIRVVLISDASAFEASVHVCPRQRRACLLCMLSTIYIHSIVPMPCHAIHGQ